MKKRKNSKIHPIWIIFILFIFFLIGLIVYLRLTPQDELLPEVKTILAVPEPLDPTLLRQDVFVGLMSLNAPKDINYMDVGVQVMMKNQAHLIELLSTPNQDSVKGRYSYPEDFYEGKEPLIVDFKIDDNTVSFSCSDLDNQNCISKTQLQQKIIAELIQKNAVLLERYLAITQLPLYASESYQFNPEMLDPRYDEVLKLSWLRLAQAIIAFNSGHTEQAFAILEQERRFAQRILEEDRNMLGKMFAIRMLYTQFNTLSQLLDTPEMQAHLNDPHVQALFSPLSEKAQRGFAKGFETQQYEMIHLHYSFVPEQLFRKVSLSTGERDPVDVNKEAFNRQLWDLLGITNYIYDPHHTANHEFLLCQPLIEAARLTPSEYHQKYITEGHASPKEETEKQLERTLQSKGRLYNFLGKVYLGIGGSDYEDFLMRFYDVQVYMALVNLKYEIIRHDVDINEIESFLAKAGNIAINPYTQKPFEWDAQHGRLSVPWINLHTPTTPNKEKNISVVIKPS